MSLALELAQTQIARAKPAEDQVPKTARAAIYARYSSHKQQELSIEGQLREIQEYCQKKDLKVVRAYIDRAKSGRTSTKRTEFRRMLEDAKRGEFDTIVVYKFNRFFRNLTEQVITMEDLRKVSVTMQSVHDVVPEGSGGVYMRAIYGADAEVYSLGVSEDTKRGMRDAAADYRTPGSLPMWLMADTNKKIVLNEPAARVMRQAAVMYDEGATLRQCCEYINAAGYKTRQGHKWNPTTLSASFRNVRLMGVFRFKDEILKEGIFPAAVEPDLWRRINAKLDGKHMPQRARALEEYYLTPRLFCGLCGAPMYGAIAYGAMSHGVKNVYRYYRCDNRLKNHSCKQKLVRKEIVEDAVFRAVIGTLTDENIARIALQAEKLSAETATTGAEKLRLLDELAAVNTEINNISRAIAAGIITDTTRDMLIDAERRRTGIQQRIEDAEAKEKETVRAEDVAAWLYCFREGAKKDEELKAQILQRLVARAELFEDGPHDGHVVVWCKLADAETAITEFFERTPAGGAKEGRPSGLPFSVSFPPPEESGGRRAFIGIGGDVVMYRIMVVEDDDAIAGVLQRTLEKWGSEVRRTDDFENVIEEFLHFEPHLVMMDISLPFFDGYHWCAEIRKISKVPVLFLSAAGENLNIVMALSMGADDFITKPFDLSVAVAKVEALLRRTYSFGAQSGAALAVGGAMLDLKSACLHYEGKKLELTKNEFRILQMLFEHKGEIVTRDTLISALWGQDAFLDDNTLTVNVARLRSHLEEIGLGGLVRTQKGVGYLVEEQT